MLTASQDRHIFVRNTFVSLPFLDHEFPLIHDEVRPVRESRLLCWPTIVAIDLSKWGKLKYNNYIKHSYVFVKYSPLFLFHVFPPLSYCLEFSIHLHGAHELWPIHRKDIR